MLDAIGAIRFQFLSTGPVARSIGTSDENGGSKPVETTRDPEEEGKILYGDTKRVFCGTRLTAAGGSDFGEKDI